MASADLSEWNSEYIVWPGARVFPSGDLYPDRVPEVTTSTTQVHGYLGSVWERVTDESAYNNIIQATQDLTDAIQSIPVALDMVTRSSDGKTVNAAVVSEIIARYVTGQEGEFVKLTAGQLAADSVGANQIQAGAIDGTIITGATIRTSATNPRVQMDSTGLYTYNASGEQTLRVSSADGSIYLRGDVGIADSWSVTRFTDLKASTGTDYATDGFRWGSGLYFQVTDRSMAGNGSVSLVKSPSDSSYSFQNKYGIRIQAPIADTSDNSAAPYLTLWETGFEVKTHNETNSRMTFTRYGFFSSGDNTRLVCRNRYQDGGDTSDQGFWASGSSSGADSGYYFYVSAGENGFWALSDRFYLRLGQGLFTFRTSYNDTASARIFNTQYSWFGFSSRAEFYVTLGKTGGRQVKLYIAGAYTATQLVASDTHSMLYTPWGSAYVNSSGFQVSGGTKNFVMQVPTLSETRGGMNLVHSTTESPGAGIEYWTTEEVPESGLVIWALPDYVPYIASQHGARAVLVTPSTGTATAVLHDEMNADSGWYVEVHAEPGATVNILVKLNRILDNADGTWSDDGFPVWRVPDLDYLVPQMLPDGGLGPLTEDAQARRETEAEDRILQAQGVDVQELQDELYAAGMTDAPIMRDYMAGREAS